jgi:hypothetical protein
MAKLDPAAANLRFSMAYGQRGRSLFASGKTKESAASFLSAVEHTLPLVKPWLRDQQDARWGDSFDRLFERVAQDYVDAEMGAGNGNRGAQVLHNMGVRFVDGVAKPWASFVAGEKLYLAWVSAMEQDHAKPSATAENAVATAKSALRDFLARNAEDTSLKPIHDWLAPLRKIGAF